MKQVDRLDWQAALAKPHTSRLAAAAAADLAGLKTRKVMSETQFHDEIMRQGNMPIALIRLAVTREKLTRDRDTRWKFYGDLPDR